MDSMLKGISRWLRFLGFPARNVASLSEIRNIVNGEKNYLFLTSSRKHLEASGIPGYLMKSATVPEQLDELNDEFGIYSNIELLSLCTICNVKIQPVSKVEIKDQIPVKVLDTHEEFRRCPVCKRIYWEGGHIDRLKEKLRRMGVPV